MRIMFYTQLSNGRNTTQSDEFFKHTFPGLVWENQRLGSPRYYTYLIKTAPRLLFLQSEVQKLNYL